MAQIVYRGNLSTSSIPMLSESFGRSIIFKGQDQNWVRQVTSPEDPDKDIGVPQVYYCHNVMPTSVGFESVGYETQLAGLPANTEFTAVMLLRDSAENKAYFVHALSGNNYILTPGSSTWVQINSVGGTGLVTTAHVSGQSYLYFAGLGCYYYNFATGLLVAQTLAGLTAALVLGIAASAGYLIAWSTNSISWSSTIDPTDFVPSLITGAGGGSVEGTRGAINVCAPHTFGILIYTTGNIVAAVYSGNSRFPFSFREIVGSGGASSLALIAWDANSGNQYAYTTSGMQLVSIQQTQTVMPEVTDFISGQYFEDFNETTLLFTRQALTSNMQKKLTVVADRYLIMSYGISTLTHALVYDLIQKRWGKLKIAHVDCFEFQLLNPSTIEIPKKSLAFLQVDGTIKTVDFSLGSPTSSGVMLLGKYQYVRARVTQLEQVTLENVKPGATFKLYAVPSIDGKSLGTPVLGYPKYTGPASRDYSFHLTALNHSLICIGAFYASSVELTFNIGGTR